MPEISSTSRFSMRSRNSRAYAESDSTYRRCPSAYTVSNASEDFPDPLTPVTTVSALCGISTLTFFRLCTRAPRMRKSSCCSRIGGMVSLMAKGKLRQCAFRTLPKLQSIRLQRNGGKLCLEGKKHRRFYCCCSLMLPIPPFTERWMVVGDLPYASFTYFPSSSFRPCVSIEPKPPCTTAKTPTSFGKRIVA